MLYVSGTRYMKTPKQREIISKLVPVKIQWSRVSCSKCLQTEPRLYDILYSMHVDLSALPRSRDPIAATFQLRRSLSYFSSIHFTYNRHLLSL